MSPVTPMHKLVMYLFDMIENKIVIKHFTLLSNNMNNSFLRVYFTHKLSQK